MKVLPIFLILIFSTSILFADPPDQNAGSTAFQKFVDNMNKGWDDIKNTAVAPAGAAAVGINSLFDTLKGSSCDDPFLSVQNPNPNPAISPDTVNVLWIAPTILALFVVFFGIAAFYMLGQLLSSPSLIALAKDELYQTTITIRRVMVILVAIGMGGLWFSFSAGNASADPIYGNPRFNSNMMDAALQFTRVMITEMSTDYSMLLLYNTVVHTIYSSTMWFGVTWRAMYSFNMGPILKPLIDVIGTSLQFLSLGISEWLLHLVTLCIIKKWTWSLFIPLGILLRAIPFTRNAGEALIAIAFSLALVYPFMFLIDYEVHKLMRGNIIDAQKAINSFITNSGIFNVFGTAVISMLLTSGVLVPFFMGGIVSLAFELVRGSVYYIVMMAVLLPFFNIFVTLTAAKETAKFFGVNVNFFGFLKLI
ncbi:hypothetical protein HY988_00770 [Candidatus Micrarchaeota archaeon]|nr:hypothetical protein [Candidatus Micrarchaeota archaeon]